MAGGKVTYVNYVDGEEYEEHDRQRDADNQFDKIVALKKHTIYMVRRNTFVKQTVMRTEMLAAHNYEVGINARNCI